LIRSEIPFHESVLVSSSPWSPRGLVLTIRSLVSVEKQRIMITRCWRPSLAIALATTLWIQESVAWLCTVPSVPCLSKEFLVGPPRVHDGILRLRMRSGYDAEGDSDEDDDEEDDDEPPSVDVKDFKAPTTSYGLFKGRSSPFARKAMGTSATSKARIYICQGCGSEFIKYWGRCPTCKGSSSLDEGAAVALHGSLISLAADESGFRMEHVARTRRPTTARGRFGSDASANLLFVGHIIRQSPVFVA
jgi:Rubredoxin metal binding domain